MSVADPVCSQGMESIDYHEHPILYLDDDKDNRQRLLRECRHRFRVFEASFVEEADAILERERICVLITDNRMPWGKGQPTYENTGLTYLARMRKTHPHILRALVTFVPEERRRLTFPLLEEAGVQSWIDSWVVNDWEQKARELVEKHVAENVYCQSGDLPDQDFPDMVGKSRAAQDLRERIQRVCERGLKEPILVIGESGVGKELASRMIHHRKFGAGKPWIALSVANLSGDNARDALFGHRRGAYTNATEDRPGALEQAGGGTLLLDDIDHLDLRVQAQLLRALQEREIMRAGEEHRPPRPVDVQVICTTNKDLEKLARQGKFSKDLFNRISWFVLEVPALRNRKEDIWALARHCLRERNKRIHVEGRGREVNGIEIQAFRALLLHNWKGGNIRELQEVIHSAAINASTSLITVEDLPRKVRIVPDRILDESSSEPSPWKRIDEEAENYKHLNRVNAIIRAYIQAKKNKTLSAEILGINPDPKTGRVTLQNYLAQKGWLERLDQECSAIVWQCWEEAEEDPEKAAEFLNQRLTELSAHLPVRTLEGKDLLEIVRKFGLSEAQRTREA